MSKTRSAGGFDEAPKDLGRTNMKTNSGDPFSYAVIGKAMEVHRELGPGLDEIFYHELLSARLREAGISHTSRARESLVHRGQVADTFEADLLFASELVAELKCLHGGFDPEHYVQVFCYLKFWRLPAGLLFDFGKESLVHRRVNPGATEFRSGTVEELLDDSPIPAPDRQLASALCHSSIGIARQYGGGYRDTTYRGLLAADLAAEGVECATKPIASVRAGACVLGDTCCDCLNVAGRIGVLVLALRDDIRAADIAILRTYLRLLGLPHGLVLNFAKDRLDYAWIRTPPK